MDFIRRKKANFVRIVRGVRSKHRLSSSTEETAHLLPDNETGSSPQEGGPPFGFLDLPPELRNRIYENLLLFESADPCHPEILASCKKINQEASGILYENNRIIIDIEMAGVFAHGVRCGRYVPAQRSIGTSVTAVDFTTLKWPEYLRRVRLLYINIPDIRWYRREAHANTSTMIPASLRKASIGNILYSLCVMLRGDHHENLAIGSNLGFDTPEDLKTTYYPMRFLGFACISLTRHRHDQICSLINMKAVRAVHPLRANNRKARVDLLKGCMSVITHVAVDHDGSKVLRTLGLILASVIMMGAGVVGTIDPDTGNHCYDSARVFTNTIKYAIMELRILLETNEVSTRSPALCEKIDLLLHLDIELRATPTFPVTGKAGKKAHSLQRQKRAEKLIGPTLLPAHDYDIWTAAPIILKHKTRHV